MLETTKENFKEVNIAKDFVFNPKKLYCRDHQNVEIEYCNSISGNFYCKKCLPKYKGQNDKVLTEICKEVQEMLSALKTNH
jgi:late competence protein required for DNA uptake (superfamily II DNA/RNA helicase)